MINFAFACNFEVIVQRACPRAALCSIKGDTMQSFKMFVFSIEISSSCTDAVCSSH